MFRADASSCLPNAVWFPWNSSALPPYPWYSLLNFLKSYLDTTICDELLGDSVTDITFCKIVNYFVMTRKVTDKAPFFCNPNPPTLSQLRLSDKTRRGHEDCLQQKRTSLCRQNTGPCVNRVVKDICAAEKYGCTIG